ncbi:MAG: glycoside hydrolase family 2 protein [Gemmatimonadota bacterium]
MSASGRGRIRAISAHRFERLDDGWSLGASAPGAVAHPDDLTTAGLAWIPTRVPSTVASTLASTGRWSLDGPPQDFDAQDWWYRTTFRADSLGPGEELWLCVDGLASLADVWLNDTRVLQVAGMFSAHAVRIDEIVEGDNELTICCRSLDSALAARRPRARWRVPMLVHQQLRWHRTTLLGRTPGWSPPAAPVGPWREIRLEYRRGVTVGDVRLDARGDGRLIASCHASGLDGSAPTRVVLRLTGAELDVSVPLAAMDGCGRFAADLVLDGVERWWPHTHGASPLYEARLQVAHRSGDADIDLGAVGFRTVTRVGSIDDFAIAVNGVPVFARGACWTPLDPVSLSASREDVTRAMRQVVDGGMNMLRVSGTMVYENEAFLDACDAHGVMLWQDFMFANMDYPDDEEFIRQVDVEVRQQLARWQGRPSLTVLCGNSEGEQQAAMWGAPRTRWSAPLFRERLAAICGEWCPGVPYVPSSATRGDFPHQSNAGPSSYYGVGAYLRPLEDARRAEVRFASECLAFANVPSAASLARSPLLRSARVHHSVWKERSPRDLGAGWDFDDVRDHYLARVFGVDPLAVRYGDHERYLEMGRVVTGDVMASVFAEWRRRRSVTHGGLIWFLRDLWDGAGWGVIDACGAPKPAWYFLRRVLAPIAVSLTDEGTNGVAIHVMNDRPRPLDAVVELALLRNGEIRVGGGSRAVTVAGHDALELNAVALLDAFADVGHAYRFGPPSHDVVVATLREVHGHILSQALHLPAGWPSARERDVGLSVQLQRIDQDTFRLAVNTRQLALAIRVEVPGFRCDDEYFHIVPGEERHLHLVRTSGDGPPRGLLQPLNSAASTLVALAD